VTQALLKFGELLGSAESMVDLGVERRRDPGRRREEMPLNRGAVVMAVAAWQMFAEETTKAILNKLDTTTPRSPLFNLIRADTLAAIGRFNTPDSRNSLDLFTRVGFDPSHAWAVAIRWPVAHPSAGAVPHKTLAFTSSEAKFELDAWLQVRHRIAHGRAFEGSDAHLKSVLSGKSKSGLTLWRADAERCIAFIRALAGATSSEAAVQFP